MSLTKAAAVTVTAILLAGGTGPTSASAVAMKKCHDNPENFRW